MTPFPVLTFAFDTLSARRGDRRVVQDVTLSLTNGQRLDLRGPNGSGKTSLLRAAAGLIRPESGAVRIIGDGGAAHPPRPGDIVWVGDRDALRPELTVDESLRFMESFPGMTGRETAIAALGLESYADTPVRLLSRGWRRRTALAAAVMAPGPVWLLDEPFAGLDEDGAARFGAALERHLARGGIALIARHSADSGPPADLTLTLERPQ